RNRRLSAAAREGARAIPRGIAKVREAVSRGIGEAGDLVELFRSEIGRVEGARVEYAELRDPDTLQPVERVEASAIFAVAVWIGDVRLIDNAVIDIVAARSAAAGGM
ncbi:MAG: pantoate--beta-alanine ligase, partial [Candidatus Binatia bacterium]